jgi:hypothetical protein
MVELTKIEKTCDACPAQWDAWDAGGHYYYIRYRWGVLSVEDLERQQRDTIRVGDNLDGSMSTEQLREHLPSIGYYLLPLSNVVRAI